MQLIIAEKPSVARSIYPVVGATTKRNGYMEGNGYIVSWCFGHLVALCMPDDYGWSGKWCFSQLPMLPDEWKFKVTEDCKEQFDILKELLNSNKIDSVVCATDADREGECIFRYVYNMSGSHKPVKRLWVSSLEESAIKDGIEKMKSDNEYDNLFNAGFCRAKADWLVGMNGSRLFSVRYNSPLNTGRVQTPTLAMIVKRDYDVKNFVKQKYFTAELDCGRFTASSEKIENEETVENIINLCNGKSATVKNVQKEVKSINPPKLFDLTSLQREANKMFGYTAQQTLDYQQALYEAKLSSYPRTDSQYITTDMVESVGRLLNVFVELFPDFGFSADNCNINRCVNDKKVVGHPAILPSENITKDTFDNLPASQQNILLLEITRLYSAVAGTHKYESSQIELSCENKIFTASGKTIIENGWKSIDENFKNNIKNAKVDDDKPEKDKSLPSVSIGDIFDSVTVSKAEHFTSPPKPYTEDTLLSAMEHAGQENYDDDTEEKKGLGTPATRAATIEGLVKHGYVERNKKQINATEKGINLINVVPDEVKSAKLTADWEMKLQSIERGEYSKDTYMTEISTFVNEICSKYSSLDSSVSFGNHSIEAIGKCPKCGGDIRKGKFGFYCTSKCGMNVAKVYGKEITESQLLKLLDGKEVSYTSNGRKTIVIPKVFTNEYNGKTYYQWGTKRG